MPLIAVQVAPHSIYDEGADHVCGLLKETAAATALMVYSHTWHDDHGEHGPAHCAEHGVPIPQGPRRLPKVWVRHAPELFPAGGLTPREQDVDHYAGVDVLDDLREPAARHGQAVWARLLEPCHQPPLIDGWAAIQAIDVDGATTPTTCLGQPAYREFWRALVDDLVDRHHWIAGLQFGQERRGPLCMTLNHGRAGFCFCDHCRREARAAGCDDQRAAAGYRALQTICADALAGAARPADGWLVSILRCFLLWPEILHWDRLWWQQREDHRRLVYRTAKARCPQLQVGCHIAYGMNLDPFKRAALPFGPMAGYSDFVKLVLYHEPTGRRAQRMWLDGWCRTLFGDLPPAQAVAALHAVLGYDAALEPDHAALAAETVPGFSPDFIAREIRRARAALPTTPIWAGIGFDVPEPGIVDGGPEAVTAACRAALDAGADALLISREYHELRLDKLRAVGAAVRQDALR